MTRALLVPLIPLVGFVALLCLLGWHLRKERRAARERAGDAAFAHDGAPARHDTRHDADGTGDGGGDGGGGD